MLRARSILRARSNAEIIRFALVGASGVVVNSVVLYLLHGMAGLPLVLASVVAVETAIVSNFVWNDLWTFSERERASFRFLRFNLFSLGGLAVNTLVLVALVSLVGIHYMVANLIAIVMAASWNFAANARWTWLHPREPARSEPTVIGEVACDDLVVVPTYEEAGNIETLVERILGAGPFGVLVVDDGSPDGTGVIADRLAEENPGRLRVIHRAAKDGLGSAYRFAFGHALELGAARVYQMDADLSHDPAILPEMRRALLAGLDLVIGSRYVPGGGVVGWPVWRQALSRGGSVYAGTILGLGQRDLTGGFKGWRSEALHAIRAGEARSNGYAFQIETTYRARLAGAEVGEVPIVFADREHGRSKMGWGIVLEAVRMVPRLRMRRPRVEPIISSESVGRGGGVR